MTDRFDPRPLVSRALGSMRRRSQVGQEPRDWAALFVMVVAPSGLGFISWAFAWSVRSADSLVAGFSLLAAALLAVVPQLAAWRQRLTDRDRGSEGVARRKLDEAVSNTLVGVLVSIVLAVLSIIIANIIVPSTPNGIDIAYPEVVRLLTAILATGGAYLALTLLLVVNLLFDAYSDANSSPSQQQDDRRWPGDDDSGRGAA